MYTWEATLPYKIGDVFMNPPNADEPLVLDEDFGGDFCDRHVKLWFSHPTNYNVKITNEYGTPVMSMTFQVGVEELGACGRQKTTWELLTESHSTLHPENIGHGTYDAQTVQKTNYIGTMSRFASNLGIGVQATILKDVSNEVNRVYTNRPIRLRVVGHGRDSELSASSTQKIWNDSQFTRQLAEAVRGKVSYGQFLGCCVSNQMDTLGARHLMTYFANTAATAKVPVTIGGYDRPIFVNFVDTDITAPSDIQYLEAHSDPRKETCTCDTLFAQHLYSDPACSSQVFKFEGEIPAGVKKLFPNKTFEDACLAIRRLSLPIVFPVYYAKDRFGKCQRSNNPQNAEARSCAYRP